MTIRRLIATGTTNSDGVFTYSYTPSANGLMNLVGETTKLQSDKVPFRDIKYWDRASSLDYNDNLWTYTSDNILFYREPRYTRLTESSSVTNFIYRLKATYHTSSNGGGYDFEINQYDGANTDNIIYIRASDNTTNLKAINLNMVGADIGQWVHFNIRFYGTKIVITNKTNGTVICDTLTSDTKYGILFQVPNECTRIYYKNFAVL